MNTVSLNDSITPVRIHPRTVNWFGIFSVAMGGCNQSLFLIGALIAGQGTIPGQGSAAVLLLIVGLFMSWAATPGWTELVMMYPNRVGGISATCAEAFKPYSPVLANLTGVCYWWGWVPTCGITALLAASALHQWYFPMISIPGIGIGLIVFFAFINLCGIKWAMRLAMPLAVLSGGLAFLSAVIPVVSGHVNWHQAFTYQLTVPFPGWFGKWTSIMAGIYLVGFAAPAYEQATSHVGEAINPRKSVPQAIFASAGMAGLYFIILPVVWLGVLGAGPLSGDLSSELGPTFAPLLGGLAKAVAMWFITLNMFHGILAPLAGPPRVLSQLADDGLLPEFMSKRITLTDAPWVTTLLTAAMAIAFLFIGDPVWLIAAANLTYLIGIAMPNVAVWLMRRDHPEMERPYRAPYGTIVLGLLAAGGWLVTTIFGFEQFGLKTVLAGIAFAYAGSMLYAWRKMMDRRKMGLPMIGHTLHLKLTGAMVLVLALDAIGYFIAVSHVPTRDAGLITMLEDIFVIVALLTISVGLILPGMIAHTAVEISNAAEKLVKGTLADFTRAMRALAAGDLEGAKADFKMVPVTVHSHDEISDMAVNFNKLQQEIGSAALGLEGARESLLKSNNELARTNELLRIAEKRYAEEQIEKLRNEHAIVLNSVGEGIHWLDHDGRIKFENPASAKMLGYETTELIGKPAHITMHHSHADKSAYPQSQCHIYATLKDGVIRRVKDEVFWRKDGTSFPVEYTCTPVLDENGSPKGCVVLFTDITERKRAEKQIEKQVLESKLLYEITKMSARTDSLAEAMQGCVNTICQLTSWSIGHILVPSENGIKELKSSNIWFIKKEDENALIEFKKISDETTFVPGDGLPGRIWESGESAWICNVHDDSNFRRKEFCKGSIKGAYGFPIKINHEVVAIAEFFSRDEMKIDDDMTITIRSIGEQLGRVIERKRAEKDIGSAQIQLLQSEKLASIGQLAAGVAHEINNPVGFISNNTEILEQYISDYARVLKMMGELKLAIIKEDAEKIKDLVKQASKLEEEINLEYIMDDVGKLLEHNKKGIERIRKIVMDLRTFAREDTDEKNFVRIEEVIDSILSIVHSEIKYKADLIKDYAETPVIKCNTQRLGQVFINILINATHAIQEKGVIRIKTYVQGEYVCVDVSDNGHGIEDKNMKKIFDAFFTTKPIGQGTGLGLSISYEIIKKHGGDIKVKSKVGTGTTFTIMLPIVNVGANI